MTKETCEKNAESKELNEVKRVPYIPFKNTNERTSKFGGNLKLDQVTGKNSLKPVVSFELENSVSNLSSLAFSSPSEKNGTILNPKIKISKKEVRENVNVENDSDKRIPSIIKAKSPFGDKINPSIFRRKKQSESNVAYYRRFNNQESKLQEFLKNQALKHKFSSDLFMNKHVIKEHLDLNNFNKVKLLKYLRMMSPSPKRDSSPTVGLFSMNVCK